MANYRDPCLKLMFTPLVRAGRITILNYCCGVVFDVTTPVICGANALQFAGTLVLYYLV